jgi:hypothetical protein
MKNFLKVTLLAGALMASTALFSQILPPQPNGGKTPTEGGNTPVGGGAPIAGGLEVLMALAGGWALIKSGSIYLHRERPEK